MLSEGDLSVILEERRRRTRRPSDDGTEHSVKQQVQNPFLGVLIVLDKAIETLQSGGDKSDIVKELLELKTRLQNPAQIDMTVLQDDVARLGVLLEAIKPF